MRIALIALCVTLLIGCNAGKTGGLGAPKTINTYYQNTQAVQAILDARGKIAEGSLEECMHSYLQQGLPLKEVVLLCGTRLQQDDKTGFGVDTIGSRPGRGAFDPASVQSACATGNPQFGKDPGKGMSPLKGPVGYSVMVGGKQGTDYLWEKGDSERTEVFGQLSWDGKGKEIKDAEGNVVATYKGLTKEEALLEKTDNVEASKKADAEAKKVEADPTKTAAEKKAAKDKADAAAKKAQADPNVVPKDNSETANGLQSACDAALEGARELLRECNRNGWKSADCRDLAAKMNHCPDPELAYISPDEGYACGEKLDPAAVAALVTARCREITRPGPDGKDPCVPLKLEDGGYRQQGGHDVCSDPHAYVDPDGAGCMLEVVVGEEFGKIDINEIIIIAMDRLGGPLVVLPNRNPTGPKPGGDPRPGPTP